MLCETKICNENVKATNTLRDFKIVSKLIINYYTDMIYNFIKFTKTTFRF